MIKNLLKTTLLSILFTACTLATVPTISHTETIKIDSQHISAQIGIVESVINKNAQISTFDGNGWYLEDTNLKPKELYIIVFNTKGTTNIYDDEIISINKLN